MRVKFIKLVAVAALCASFEAHAQFAVIDVANLTQAIKEVEAWAKQYKQMSDQHKQLQQEYASITGSRGLGNFSNNPLLQGTVPPELLQIYGAMQNQGAQGLTGAAKAIREKLKIYNCEDRKGTDRITCEQLLNNLSQQQALLQQALTLTGIRTTQIQALQDKINATSDPKSIAELQARLQAETTQVANDANRLLLMRSLSDAADRAAEQSVREKYLHSLSLHTDGTESFKFVPMK
ncbi:P-type DNA transfer protein VirB5 [Duganella sp. BuS-21]|uniref:P-type DNA transfer protein VirB5 n=1 Tax=Duganella sp. BuS-21 TaxID=2943848 RepID=UPI0035A5DB65